MACKKAQYIRQTLNLVWICHLTVFVSASHLTSLGLRFLAYKQGTRPGKFPHLCQMVISVLAMLLVWGLSIRALHWLGVVLRLKKPQTIIFPGQIIALKTYLQFVLVLAKQSVKITFKPVIARSNPHSE